MSKKSIDTSERKRKLRADPGMYAKMRRQRRQKARIGGGMIDHVAASKGQAIGPNHIRRDAFAARRNIANVGEAKYDQYDYIPTSYEQGVRDAAAGLDLPVEASRQAREGFTNKHRERLRLLIHMLASMTGRTTKDLWRMRKRLACQYMVQTGLSSSTSESRQLLDNHPMPDVLLCKIIDSIVSHVKTKQKQH